MDGMEFLVRLLVVYDRHVCVVHQTYIQALLNASAVGLEGVKGVELLGGGNSNGGGDDGDNRETHCWDVWVGGRERSMEVDKKERMKSGLVFKCQESLVIECRQGYPGLLLFNHESDKLRGSLDNVSAKW